MSEPMTAHELAQRLLDGPDLPVHIGYDYGDRTHRTAAPGITEVTEAKVHHSDYIQTDQVFEDAEGDREVPDDARDAIILTHLRLEVW
jgi:hypothetical protein